MKRVRPFVFGIVVLGLFLWTRAYVRQSAVGSVRQLPDGASIEVVAVTYGAQHKVVIGQIWEKLLLHLAPKNFVTNKKLPRIEYKFLTKSRAAVTPQQIRYRSETTNFMKTDSRPTPGKTKGSSFLTQPTTIGTRLPVTRARAA